MTADGTAAAPASRWTAMVVALVMTAACAGGTDRAASPAESPATTSDGAPGSSSEVVLPDGTAATFRRPADATSSLAPVLLVAGSGPTDRDGNTPVIPGRIDTLAYLADTLAEAGVASLRFDKLGVGGTTAPSDPADLTFHDFVDQADVAYEWLSEEQPGDGEPPVVGHSEGGLIALELARRHPVERLALLAPPWARYLDVIRDQVVPQFTAEQLAAYDETAAQLRATGRLDEAPVEPALAQIFAPSSLRFLATADRSDPAALAAALPASTHTLLLGGTADVQVPCARLDAVSSALESTRLVTECIPDVNHVLRVSGPDGGPESYTDPAFSHSPRAGELVVELASAE